MCLGRIFTSKYSLRIWSPANLWIVSGLWCRFAFSQPKIAPCNWGPRSVNPLMVMSAALSVSRIRYARESSPFSFISGSGRLFVEGFHAAVCVRMVWSLPAPFRVMPFFGSSGASSSYVPAAISITLPSAPLFTAAGLVGIAVSVTGNEVAQRFGRARVVAWAMGAAAALSLLCGWTTGVSMLLAIVAVLFSLIGAYYYLRFVKLMYFDQPNDPSPIDAPFDMKVLMSANGLAVAFLGIFPQALMSLCAFSLLRSL